MTIEVCLDETLTEISFVAFQWDLIDEELGKKNGAPKGETIKKYTQDLILLGRTSVPNDVASLVSFLGSKDSDYMTGQT
jgi:NAD(P)-dependent dehydrogenase (short-subunit alcohol dehydrogenase family)